MAKFEALEQSELTQSWTIEQRAALAHFLDDEKQIRGKTFVKPNDKNSGLYFIYKGKVKLQYQNIEAILEAGMSFGELSLVHPTKKQAKMTALEDLELFVLSEEKWVLLRKESPTTALKLLESICQKFSKFLTHAPAPPGSFGTKSV